MRAIAFSSWPNILVQIALELGCFPFAEVGPRCVQLLSWLWQIAPWFNEKLKTMCLSSSPLSCGFCLFTIKIFSQLMLCDVVKCAQPFAGQVATLKGPIWHHSWFSTSSQEWNNQESMEHRQTFNDHLGPTLHFTDNILWESIGFPRLITHFPFGVAV